MFQRYTERAQRVGFFARDEAADLGSTCIAPEFLLLGILREDPKVVNRWLARGDWLANLREEVAQHVSKKSKSDLADLKFSPETRRILIYEVEEADRLSHRAIDVEHLFLGLMREPESYAARLLLDRGVDAKTVRKTLDNEHENFGRLWYWRPD